MINDNVKSFCILTDFKKERRRFQLDCFVIVLNLIVLDFSKTPGPIWKIDCLYEWSSPSRPKNCGQITTIAGKPNIGEELGFTIANKVLSYLSYMLQKLFEIKSQNLGTSKMKKKKKNIARLVTDICNKWFLA